MSAAMLLLLALNSGESPTLQSARLELKMLSETADALATAVDHNSSELAVEKLRQLRPKALAIANDKAKLPAWDDREWELFSEAQLAVMTRFQNEIERIKHVSGGPLVRQEIQALFLAWTRGVDMRETLSWRWSEGLCDLDVCLKDSFPETTWQATRDRHDDKIYLYLKDGPKIPLTGGDCFRTAVVTRHRDVLLVAEYCPIATGCCVSAIDLKTGRQLWSNRLLGNYPTPFGHSKYGNRVNIRVENDRVIVYGHESDGKYAEAMDMQTGQTIANQRFDATRNQQP